MPEGEKFSPEEISKIQKERTLSDAELIKGGAHYEGKRLKLTPEQMEKMQALNKEKIKDIEGRKARVAGIIEKFNQQMVETKDWDDYLRRNSQLLDAIIDTIIVARMYEEAWEYSASAHRGKRFDGFDSSIRKEVVDNARGYPFDNWIKAGVYNINDEAIKMVVSDIEKYGSPDQS